MHAISKKNGEIQCRNTVPATAPIIRLRLPWRPYPNQKLATEFGVHPTQTTRWEQELAENAVDLFGKAKKKKVNHESDIADLHRRIGKLKVENDF
jgi:hypothetical protein